MESVDMTAQNIENIGALFPNCITETFDKNGEPKKAINFEILKQMLSNDVLEGDEAYEFTWVGKKASIVEANKPIRKTLRPCKEESLDWDKTENLYIEGDNLEVLKLLQESYLGKVKMIYIDPPYNTGNDFIYNDDFKMSIEEYAEEQGEYDDEGNRMFKNTETNGRFHSDWCSMMYPRLMLARNLLSDDGVIFISIDDKEQDNLKKICDEVFGADNFISTFIRKSSYGEKTAKPKINRHHEYFHIYSKYKYILSKYETIRGKENEYTEYSNPDNDPKGEWKKDSLLIKIDTGRKGLARYGIFNPYLKITDYPPVYYDESNRKQWHYIEDTFKNLLENNQVIFYKTLEEKGNSEYSFYIKKYKPVNITYRNISSIFAIDNEYTNSKGTKDFVDVMGNNFFMYPKPEKFIRDIVGLINDNSAIVMDFFSGSSTTANAVMQLNAEDGGNRKFIMVQLPEKTDEKSEAYKAGYKNICEIGKERIRRAGQKIHEDNKDKEGIENLDIGFRVLKLDDTNMTDVYYSPADYSQDLLAMLESNVKSDRNDLDLLFGCLLEWGLPLSLPYSSEQIDGCTVHNYNDGDLIACFDENIPDSVIKEIAQRQPLRAVFRDSSFVNSPSKINVEEIFKLLAPNTRVKII